MLIMTKFIMLILAFGPSDYHVRISGTVYDSFEECSADFSKSSWKLEGDQEKIAGLCQSVTMLFADPATMEHEDSK